MQLTPAQLSTLKTWLTSGAGAGLDDEAARAALNAPASPAYYVWNQNVRVVDILDKLTFANYTPNDSPPASTGNAQGTNDALLYNNRAFLASLKQTNLTLLFVGRTTFDATKLNLRVGLNDATTNLPTGTSGATRSGGWSAILPILSRTCTVAEKLFAFDDGAGIGNTVGDARGANTNPDAPGVGTDGLPLSGDIDAQNINDARNAA